MKTIAIVGSAGRLNDYDKMSLGTYCWMWSMIEGMIDHDILFPEYNNHPAFTLVSGGAAFSDHCAVKLFLDYDDVSLKLHLPAPFDMVQNEFEHTQDGKVANYYHRRFSAKCGWNENQSLLEIRQAIDRGAIITINDGFKVRNALVAKDADYMFACTYGDKARLKRGGTSHTMSLFHMLKSAERSFHLNLTDLNVYTPALV